MVVVLLCLCCGRQTQGAWCFWCTSKYGKSICSHQCWQRHWASYNLDHFYPKLYQLSRSKWLPHSYSIFLTPFQNWSTREDFTHCQHLRHQKRKSLKALEHLERSKETIKLVINADHLFVKRWVISCNNGWLQNLKRIFKTLTNWKRLKEGCRIMLLLRRGLMIVLRQW